MGCACDRLIYSLSFKTCAPGMFLIRRVGNAPGQTIQNQNKNVHVLLTRPPATSVSVVEQLAELAAQSAPPCCAQPVIIQNRPVRPPDHLSDHPDNPTVGSAVRPTARQDDNPRQSERPTCLFT